MPGTLELMQAGMLPWLDDEPGPGSGPLTWILDELSLRQQSGHSLMECGLTLHGGKSHPLQSPRL